jgi:hypothetical protein
MTYGDPIPNSPQGIPLFRGREWYKIDPCGDLIEDGVIPVVDDGDGDGIPSPIPDSPEPCFSIEFWSSSPQEWSPIKSVNNLQNLVNPQ